MINPAFDLRFIALFHVINVNVFDYRAYQNYQKHVYSCFQCLPSTAYVSRFYTILFCKKALESNIFLFINNTLYCRCLVRVCLRVKQKHTWNRYAIRYPLRLAFIYSFEDTRNEMELLMRSKDKERPTLMLIICQMTTLQNISCFALFQL